MALFIATILRTETLTGYKCPNLPQCDCNKAITSVDCSRRYLTSIPDIPVTALHLNLGSNLIYTIPSRAFSNLSKLQSLYLTLNHIQTIEPSAFEGLESLTDIHLAYNSIDTIPTRAFSKLTKLQSLDLHNNQLQTIEPSVLDGLQSLAEISLSDNNIDTIPRRAFSKLSKLQSLDLSYNRIQTIEPSAFEGLEGLTNIDLSRNHIDTIPTRAFSKLTKLQRLVLNYNAIGRILPSIFDGLESLMFINLDYNLLTEVPSVGFQPRLSKVLLSRNKIVNATFPLSYRHSCNLTVDLSQNNIKTLDYLTFSSFAGSTIMNMKLSYNNINTVAPGTFDRLKSVLNLELDKSSLSIEALSNIADGLSRKQLTFLDLSGVFRTKDMLHAGLSVFMKIRIYNINLGLCSSFKSITSEVELEDYRNIIIIRVTEQELFQFSEIEFPGSRNLMWISFAANRLTLFTQYLPESLELLDLKENQITDLGPRTTNYLGKLKKLILSNNHVYNIWLNAFDGLRNLQVLDLAQNQMHYFRFNPHEPLQNLTHCYLGNNKLSHLDSKMFNGFVSLRVLDLSDNDLEDVPEDTFRSLLALQALHYRGDKLFSGLLELEEISISNNNIRHLSDSVFRDQVSLKVLKIDHNELSGWGTNLFKFTKNLIRLDLSHNMISVLTESNLHDLDNHQELYLTGNLFACGCDLLWFREWLDRTSVVLPGKNNYTCSTCSAPEEWRGMPLHDFTKDKIDCRNIPVDVIAGSVSAALFICISAGIAVYKNRWRLRLRLYLLSKRGRLFLTNTQNREQRANYEAINDDRAQGFYDAYISSSENDDDWVLHHLLPGVDNGRYDDDNRFGGDFKLYHNARDKDPGVSAIANIHEHLSRSTKMIVVLTQHFVNDGMNKFELDQATTMYHNDELDDIIVIKVGNVPARKVPVNLYTQMRRGMFLEWDGNEVAVETFKAKLKDRLHGTGVELC